MKKFKLFSIALLLSLITLSIDTSAQKMTGLTVLPSFDGPGIGFRQWVSPKFGWGLEGQTNWGFSNIIGRGRLMFGLHTAEKARYYGLISGGYMAINEDIIEVSAPSIVAGIGAEWLLGFKKNKGLGIEIGYQYGKADYSYTMDIPGYGSETFNNTFELPPIYIGASFSFYFTK